MLISSNTGITTSGGSFTVINRRKAFGYVVLFHACLVLAYIINHQYPTGHVANSNEAVKRVAKSSYLIENNQETRAINIAASIAALCRGVQSLNKYQLTSTDFSRASSNVANGTGYILVNIETFDKKNRPKRIGGDIILVWVKQSTGDGRVAGTVTDHRNGSYTGMVRVFWNGRTNVYFSLASASENTCLRYKSQKKYGNIVYTLRQPFGLRATFLNNNVTEKTPCNTNNFIYGSLRVCNFTTLNGGMSWFCGHPIPGAVRCSDLNSFSLGPFNTSTESQNDKIQDPGHGMFKNSMAVNVSFKFSRNSTVSCKGRSPMVSWTEPSPTGYYLNTRWEPVNYHTTLKHTNSRYRSCLRNKTLIMLGDSTVRQYVNFFLKNTLGLDKTIDKGFTFGPNFETYHGHNTFSNHGITIIYRKQAMPLHFSGPKIPINNISSFPQILDSFARGKIPDSSIIILLNYHTHFSAFPPEKYRERLNYLGASLKRFFIAKPSAKVFFKGPSPCINDSKSWDPRISLLFKKILEEEFVEIRDKVTYLDVWEISVAHNNKNVHPRGDALKSQLQQFMYFIC